MPFRFFRQSRSIGNSLARSRVYERDLVESESPLSPSQLLTYGFSRVAMRSGIAPEVSSRRTWFTYDRPAATNNDLLCRLAPETVAFPPSRFGTNKPRSLASIASRRLKGRVGAWKISRVQKIDSPFLTFFFILFNELVRVQEPAMPRSTLRLVNKMLL